MSKDIKHSKFNKLNEFRFIISTFTIFVVLWVILSYLNNDPNILPTPITVWEKIVAQFQSGELQFHTGMTLFRVFIASSLALVVGFFIGIILGLFPHLNRWLDPWVIFFLNLPALVVIVLCYLWIGLNEVAAIVAVALNKTAMVIVAIREGVRSMNPEIDDMAYIYRMNVLKRLQHIWLPQLVPFLTTSIRTGLAVIWKIVLVVEFLGRPNGVGFKIHLYFQLFDIANVLAYSLTFVAIMLFIERGILQPIEARATFWRKKFAAT